MIPVSLGAAIVATCCAVRWPITAAGCSGRRRMRRRRRRPFLEGGPASPAKCGKKTKCKRFLRIDRMYFFHSQDPPVVSVAFRPIRRLRVCVYVCVCDNEQCILNMQRSGFGSSQPGGGERKLLLPSTYLFFYPGRQRMWRHGRGSANLETMGNGWKCSPPPHPPRHPPHLHPPR